MSKWSDTSSEYLKLRKKRLEEQKKAEKEIDDIAPLASNGGWWNSQAPTATELLLSDKQLELYRAAEEAKENGLLKALTDPRTSDTLQVGDAAIEKSINAKFRDRISVGLEKKGLDGVGKAAGWLTSLGPVAAAGDVLSNVGKGFVGSVEGISDLILHGGARIADWAGKENLSDALDDVADEDTAGKMFDPMRDYFNENSWLGKENLLDSAGQGLGQVFSLVGVGALGKALGLGVKGVTALTTGTTAASSMGAGISEAHNQGKAIKAEYDSVIKEYDDKIAELKSQDAEGYAEFINELEAEKEALVDERNLAEVTEGQAWAYGAIKGVVDAGTELLAGGFGKAVNAVGLSKGLGGLDDIAAKKVSSLFQKQLTKNLVEYGIKASGEGFEEVLAGIGTAWAKSVTYLSEEEFGELVKDENLFEQFLVGVITSGIAQSGYVPGMKEGSVREANKAGRDYITGLNQTEQTVIDKVYEKRLAEEGEEVKGKKKTEIYDRVVSDFEKGYITTDDIEEILGGDTYKAYSDTVKSEEALVEREKTLRDEFNTLNKMKQGEMTGEQVDRREELRSKLSDLTKQIEDTKKSSKKAELKTKLSEEVFSLVKDTRLVESYNESARRAQAYTADLSKYDAKQQEVIKKAVDSGILNNTNRTHEFVDLVAKISADKGVPFDFTDNAKLKESGFAIDGKAVNGFVTKDGVTINIQSSKSLNSVVGHEITHVLEGTDLYNTLQQTVIEYAKAKGDYQGRYDTLTKLYEGVEGANIDSEITADLVGDYLFTDESFVKNLSTQDRNLFQKIYDEVKYLLKVATAGSKEARELEKVKRAFDKAYREQSSTSENGETQYAIESNVVDKNGEHYEHVVSLEYNIFNKVRRNGKSYIDFVRNNLIKQKITVYDSAGVAEVIEFAGEKERVKKDGAKNSHPVIGELTQAKNELKKLVILNSVETAEISDFANHRDEHSHQWLDENGWDERTSYVMAKDGMIYPVTLHIAKTKDGRSVLYDVNVKIKEGVAVDKNATSSLAIKQTKQAVKTTKPSSGKIPQNPKNVKGQFSLTQDSEGRKLSDGQKEFFKDSKVVDEKGNLKVMYHGSPETFTVFDKSKAKASGYYGKGFYFTDSDSHAKQYGNTYNVYLNITNPIQDGTNDITKEQLRKFVEAVAENEDYGIDNYGYDATVDSVTESVFGKSDFAMLMDINASSVGNMVEAIELFNEVNGTDYNGITTPTETVAFYPEQIKSADNVKPTSDPDIRYSLTEYTEEEKKAHNKTALEHFGKTYSWAETGYLLLDGTRLDFSGKHDGAPGGYRTVDHREIRDALGDDYGGEDYSGSLIQFMSEGNIRIIPEVNGINLSVQPTKAQEEALANFISRYRGEVVLDIDGENGYTVVSVEYPIGTRYGKVLKDIREWFENGTRPADYSLSEEGEEHPVHGNYNVYGEDIALETEDVAPVEETAPVQEAAPVQAAIPEEEDMFPDDYAPMTEEDAAAMNDETLASLTDADAPPVVEQTYDEMVDSISIETKPLKQLAKGISETLGLKRAGKLELEQVIQDFSRNEHGTREDLYNEVVRRFGTNSYELRVDEIADAKAFIREAKIKVTPDIKAEFGSPKDYLDFMRKNFGKIKFSNEGRSVDVVYEDLRTEMQNSALFPEDIINPADRLRKIAEVANEKPTELVQEPLPDEMMQEVTDMIYDSIVEYKDAERAVAAFDTRVADFAGLMQSADDYAPLVEGDIAPVAPVAPAVEAPAIEAPTVEAPAVDANQPIKTVKDRLAARLQNTETEIATNQELRNASREVYDQEIARLYEEYDAKPNKHTKAAQDLLRRAAQMQTRRANTDADYAKRLSDLEAKRAKQAEELRSGESAAEQGAMRAELHTRIVDDAKTAFAERGHDFDEVLESAKDLSTFSTVDNTPQRVMEKTFGYEEGQILSDLTVNKVAQHETEGIEWLNSFTDRKHGLIAKISKKYNIKPGSKKSAAAQMYAEGFYVAKNGDIVEYGDKELAKDFPDARERENIKGLAKDPRIRQIYDETLAKINESRARNAYPEIQKLDNYFLHFRAMNDTFSKLGIPFNPNDIRAKDLPTDLNGVTADLKPGQPYFASANHRMGQRTSFDLLGGLEMYLTSAKDQIYHIDDIQTLRALRNYIADTYGQAKGLEGLDLLTEDEAQKKIEDVYKGHLSNFAKFLNEEANVIAGKTSLTDRGLEGVIGRRGITFLGDLNKQVGSNMVGFNVSSSLTNLLAAVQAFAKTNKFDFVKGLAQTAANTIGSIAGKTDGFAEASPVIIRRKGAERFHRTAWQKASDAGYVLMGAVDNISTEIIARAKYNELTRKGMDGKQAHIETDKWVSRLMGDRSLGQQPLLYNSKMLGMFTKFQLEVRNQLDSQFYDTIQEAKMSTKEIENGLKRNAVKAAKVGATFLELAVLQHLFGKAFESIAGYNPAFDIIDALMKTFGWDDEEDEEDTVLDNVQEGFLALMGDLPYTSTLTGGRIPISSALPVEQLVTGKDQYGNEKSRLDTIKEALPYYVLPSGYGQIRKTTQGLSMFDDEHPVAGSYTDSNKLRFPVEDTIGNKVQAGIFGQWASENARDYFDNERKPLEEKQIQEYMDVDLPIGEYWDYREGLSGLKTLAEKADYINSLDLAAWQKNLLINNIADRKEDIDMTDYDEYADFEEFDYAQKNPEKYEFLQQNNVSYAEYKALDDDAKDAYQWAFKNPDKQPLVKAITGDIVKYREYAGALNKITANKDGEGKSISGSRKNKVIDYINGLDADYGEKIILLKSEYPSEDTYNSDIIDYLNERDDISRDEMIAILRELGFTVYSDGTIEWE